MESDSVRATKVTESMKVVLTGAEAPISHMGLIFPRFFEWLQHYRYLLWNNCYKDWGFRLNVFWDDGLPRFLLLYSVENRRPLRDTDVYSRICGLSLQLVVRW